MLFSLAEKVAIFFISRHMIPLDDRDWAIYALQRYISAAFFYPILFFLGCLCCDAFTSLIFFAVFTGLRHRIGGHHAKTPLRCFAISICILFFGLGVYPTMTWLLPDTFDVLVCFSAGVFIWIIGPCNDPRIQMDLSEYRVNRKQSHLFIIIIWISTAALLYIFNLRVYAKAVTAATALAAMLLLAGIYQIGGIRNEQNQQCP